MVVTVKGGTKEVLGRGGREEKLQKYPLPDSNGKRYFPDVSPRLIVGSVKGQNFDQEDETCHRDPHL